MRINESQSNLKDLLINLSPQAFAALGLEEVAYITPSPIREDLFVLRAANGDFLGEWQDRTLAEATLNQNGLVLVDVN